MKLRHAPPEQGANRKAGSRSKPKSRAASSFTARFFHPTGRRRSWRTEVDPETSTRGREGGTCWRGSGPWEMGGVKVLNKNDPRINPQSSRGQSRLVSDTRTQKADLL